ncbi:rod shape-determining protein [Candidatus Giovannonibacteria bacterium]|nr:rod shape-determining protein [Candidatus Giovannonibacteria bacterium]
MGIFDRLWGYFSHDIGIDLGTANTLVYVRGRGIIINEPSVVAVNQKTGQVVAVGSEARRMVGRTPAHIVAVRPLVEGVISDFEITEEMISYFIKKVHSDTNKFFARPRIVIGIPSGITEVERRAVRDAARNAGGREVYLVEEPMAAAIGVGLPVQDPVGNFVVDVGGGTTDVAVISLGGIVAAKNLRVAGDKLNQDIINYVRDEFKLLLGERTAEDVKIAIGSAWKLPETLETRVRGRDLVTGLPREVIITDADVREAMSKSVKSIAESVKEVIEQTPPELISDVMHRGIALVGGGSFLKGLDKLIEVETKIPVKVPDDPITAVVRGTGIILEDVDSLREVLVEHEEELPPT